MSLRASFAIPIIPTALALAARLYGLSDKPLWLDEIITHGRANRPIWDLIANAFSNKHFPTYFIIVRAFNSPIIDEWMLRLPSAILGAGRRQSASNLVRFDDARWSRSR